MATPLTASRLLAALKTEGCRVAEYKNWRANNRNHKGSWGPVYGVMIHHTVTSGTAGSVALCYDGHSTLPGPLCHTVGAKDGTLYMVGNGRANHAGLGDGDVLQAVIAERDLPAKNEANTDGNRHFYGIELINLGNGRDPWPEPQVDAAARWAAALCRAHGWNERSVIGHLDWQPGKVDPRGFTMTSFRARVKQLLTAPPGRNEEEDPLAGYSKKELAEAVLKTDGVHDVPARWRKSNPSNEQWQFESVNAFIGDRVLDTLDEVRAMRLVIDKLADALGTAGQFDPESLKSEIREAIESITVRLDVPEGEPS